jgi:hypothetical protein
MNSCGCDSEKRELGVGAGVYATMLFTTLQVVGLTEVARTVIRLRKKTMNLCGYDSEKRERGIGPALRRSC